MDFENRTCSLAGADFQLVPTDSVSMLHFHIRKMPGNATDFLSDNKTVCLNYEKKNAFIFSSVIVKYE